MDIGGIGNRQFSSAFQNVGAVDQGENVNPSEIGGEHEQKLEKVEFDIPDLKEQIDRVEVHKLGDQPLIVKNQETNLLDDFQIIGEKEVKKITTELERETEEAVKRENAEKLFQENAKAGREITAEDGELSFVPLSMSDKDRKDQIKKQADFDKAKTRAIQQRSELNRQLDKGYEIVCSLSKFLLNRQDTSSEVGRQQTSLALISKFIADFVDSGDWSSETIQVEAFKKVTDKVKNLEQKGALDEAEKLWRKGMDLRYALDDVRRSRMQLVKPLVDKLIAAQAELSQNKSLSISAFKGLFVSSALEGLFAEAEKLREVLMGRTEQDKGVFDRAFAVEAHCREAFDTLDKELGGELKKADIHYEPGKGGFGAGENNASIRNSFGNHLRGFQLMLCPDKVSKKIDTESNIKDILEIEGFNLDENGSISMKKANELMQAATRRETIAQGVNQLERKGFATVFVDAQSDDLVMQRYEALRQRASEATNPNPQTIDGRLKMVTDVTAKVLLDFVENGWKQPLNRLDAKIKTLDDEIKKQKAGNGNPEKLAGLDERHAQLTSQSQQLHKAADELVRSRMAMIEHIVSATLDVDIRYDDVIDVPTAIEKMQENLNRLKDTIWAFRYDLDDKVGIKRGRMEDLRRWFGSKFSAKHGDLMNKMANVFTSKARLGFRHAAFEEALSKEDKYNDLMKAFGIEQAHRGSALKNLPAAKSLSDTLHQINNSIRSTPPDLWMGDDFFVRMARKRLEKLAPNGGSREFSFFMKAGVGFSMSNAARAEVLAKGGANYQVRCEGDGTVVVRVQGKIGIDAMAKVALGDNAHLKLKGSLEEGVGIEYRYADMESAVQAIARSFMGKVNLLRTADAAKRAAQMAGRTVFKDPLAYVWNKAIGDLPSSDAEFVHQMNGRGVLKQMARMEPVVRKNIVMTGHRPFLSLDGGVSFDSEFKIGGKNLSLGNDETKRELIDLGVGAEVNLGGDIAKQTEYRPYLIYLQQDFAGTALNCFEASIRRGSACLLKDDSSLLTALKKSDTFTADEFGKCFKDLAGSYDATVRNEARRLAELSGDDRAKRELLTQLGDRVRTTTEGVVALYEKWKASDACRNADPKQRKDIEESFASFKQKLVNPPIDFGDDFNRELMVEHSFDDNTFRLNFSSHFNFDVLTGLTNSLLKNDSNLNDSDGLGAGKFFGRLGAKSAGGSADYLLPLNFKFGFDTEIVRPTSDHVEPWRNVGQTKLNIRTPSGHLEAYAMLAIVSSAIAKFTGRKPPENKMQMLDILKSAGIYGVGVTSLMQSLTDLYDRVGKPILGKAATTGVQSIQEGAKNFAKEGGSILMNVGPLPGTVDFNKESDVNIQLVMVDKRLQTISFGTHDSVSLDVTLGEGFRFGVEYKDRNIVNESTVYIDAPMTTLLDRCDRMTNGAQTSKWQEFSSRNRPVFAKLYDTIRDGLTDRLTKDSESSQVKDYNHFVAEIKKIRNHYETLRNDKSLPRSLRKNMVLNVDKLEKALIAIQQNAAEKDADDLKGEAVSSTKTEAVRTLLECIVGHYHILDIAQGRVAGNRQELLSRFRIGDSRTDEEALKDLDLIRSEVEKFSSDNAAVRLTYSDSGEKRLIQSVTENKKGSVKDDPSMMKLKNDCDRMAILSLVCRACNAREYGNLPKEVKAVFKIEDFNSTGKPLSKHRVIDIINAVKKAHENGSTTKTRNPLEKGVVVQAKGSKCCFANAIVNGLKATEKGRSRLETVISEDGCTLFNEKGLMQDFDWPKDNVKWDDENVLSPFEAMMLKRIGDNPPIKSIGKAAELLGMDSDEVRKNRIDDLLSAPEIDGRAFGKELSLALSRGEVVVCNCTGAHFETITEVDLKTGFCTVVSDIPDSYGGCVHQRSIKDIALDMRSVGTSCQFFRLKQSKADHKKTLEQLKPEIEQLRKTYKDGDALITKFEEYLESDAGRSTLQSIADKDERFTLNNAYGEWLIRMRNERAPHAWKIEEAVFA